MKRLMFLLTVCISSVVHPRLTTDEKKYAQSFIGHYETNITGKFTHEYHPYLLERTAESLDELEDALCVEGLNPCGRLMLMGYEEQGVPRYTTDFKDALFTDEMARKTDAGWSLQMFNRFGLLTGFLCKDINQLSQVASQMQGAPLPMTHIDADQVEIYDGKKTIFQEHAFGEAFNLVMDAHTQLQPLLARNDMSAVFLSLISFWRRMYNGGMKITGREHVVGTQDILFSIAYMKHLQRSELPLKHFFIGPDITYPIEVSTAHSKAVTRHAQSFVKQFVSHLQPCDNKKTAYVFCSFVDGVGKSTMLGNVQNWMKHGDNVENYEHVDNSSSQLATIFSYNDKVVIADLPAQVSHFTYKPDGYVYVPTQASWLTPDECDEVARYVQEHASTLQVAHENTLHEVAQTMARTRYDLAAFEKQSPEHAYCANVILLKKHKHNDVWVSFAYNGKSYVFDARSLHGRPEIRVRELLETASSHGLKNTYPEQMVFTKGVRFPFAYQHFVTDLTTRLKKQGVERVVMVDFASMYSRSSRENIRVNYVVQQQALLDASFLLEKSFYQNFVHNAQLLSSLDHLEDRRAFSKNFRLEAMARTGLYALLQRHADTSIEGVDLIEVTRQLTVYLEGLTKQDSTFFSKLIASKMTFEYDLLRKIYGASREYVTLQQFHAPDMVALSQELVTIFTKKVAHQRINRMWEWFTKNDPLVATSVTTDQATGRKYGVLASGRKVWVLDRIEKGCKDRHRLLPLLRQVRACWYASLSNILYVTNGDDPQGRISIEEKFPTPPVVASYDDEGMIAVVQPFLQSLENKQYQSCDYTMFEIDPTGDVDLWERLDDMLYLSDWREVKTSYQGAYAYAHEWYTPTNNYGGYGGSYHTVPLVTKLCKKYHEEKGKQSVLLTGDMMAQMNRESDLAQLIWEQVSANARKNGPHSNDKPSPRKVLRDQYGGFVQETRVPVCYTRPEQYDALRLFIRSIATIDMCVKDLEADISVQRGSKRDFKAMLALLERLTLPYNYGMLSIDPLFVDSSVIEPLMGWNYFVQ